MAEEGKREVILPLLNVIDDLEKALQWTSGGGPKPCERPAKYPSKASGDVGDTGSSLIRERRQADHY